MLTSETIQQIKEGFAALLELTRRQEARVRAIELEITKLWEDLRELRVALLVKLDKIPVPHPDPAAVSDPPKHDE